MQTSEILNLISKQRDSIFIIGRRHFSGGVGYFRRPKVTDNWRLRNHRCPAEIYIQH